MIRTWLVEHRRWLDWGQLAAGALLALSPWMLGFSAIPAAAWGALAVAAICAALALAALFWRRHPAEDIAALALGLWLLCAPWALGFAGISAAAVWCHGLLGALIAALAALRLWLDHGGGVTTRTA